ncbi:MAG: hypothetical protein JNL95_04710 [Chitinophagales bacterium]|nr:hypothetical protein [Chitinophagales bacterium]
MFAKKHFVFLLFLVTILCVLVLPLLLCNQPSTQSYHGFVATHAFQKLPREKQILKCASCHKSEYENEKNGPHAFSFKSITAHKDFVNSTKYNCDFYTQHVNRSFEDCLGCHTPQNLYQTLLYDSLNQPALLAQRLLKIDHPSPPTRSIEQGRATGIDCMSCHSDGQQIKALKHLPTSEDSIPSKQTVNQVTVNNMSCYPCHFDAVLHFSPEIAIKKTGTAQCVSCHIENDRSGKGTHYFYWQHDRAEKKNPKPSLVLDDFRFSFSANKHEGVITWQNTIMPHKISPGPEMVLFCYVLDKDSAVLGSKTIRINKKKEFDREMYKTLGRNQLGIEGDDVPLDGTPIEYRFLLKHPEKSAIFKIAFMHKSQYWFPDSLGQVILIKTYPCN